MSKSLTHESDNVMTTSALTTRLARLVCIWASRPRYWGRPQGRASQGKIQKSNSVLATDGMVSQIVQTGTKFTAETAAGLPGGMGPAVASHSGMTELRLWRRLLEERERQRDEKNTDCFRQGTEDRVSSGRRASRVLDAKHSRRGLPTILSRAFFDICSLFGEGRVRM